MKKDIRKDIFTIIAVTVAAFLMALNTKTFVNTGGLYPGGMTGMSILIQRAVKQLAGIMLPFSIINITLNIIPVYIGFRFIGKKFTAFSCVMILLNSFFTDLIPNHIITQDVLLISRAQAGVRRPSSQFPSMTVLHIFYACGTINRKQAF